MGEARGARGPGIACLLVLLASPAAADPTPLALAVHCERGTCFVRGEFHVAVTDSVAWNVLSDYDHIDRFVGSILSSRVERQGDGGWLLRQRALGQVLFVRRRMEVLLRVHEEVGSRIVFQDVLEKDFSRYEGEWRIASDSSGTHVTYLLEAQPRGPTPTILYRGSLRKSVADLLEQVRAEMLRRKEPLSASPRSRGRS